LFRSALEFHFEFKFAWKSLALVSDLIYFYLHFGALRAIRIGVEVEWKCKPQKESLKRIINLLIHKHEIIKNTSIVGTCSRQANDGRRKQQERAKCD